MINHEKVNVSFQYVNRCHWCVFGSGYLTNDEYISLLHDNDVNLKKTDEDYYQVFSKYDRQLRDQFNYIDLFRTIIDTIMS